MQEVIRQTALETLMGHEATRLITIRAATGSGKSTLLRQFVRALRQIGRAPSIIQLSETADEISLVRDLLAIVENRHDSAPSFLDNFEELSQRLILALRSATTDILLILDDFQHLHSPDAIRLLTRLIYLETPAQLTFVIASRTHIDIAVSGLRLDGRLLELGPSDLKFSRFEAQNLADSVGLGLDPDTWEQFTHKVDGWIVALRLALILLRDGKLDVTELLQFSGDQRDMAAYLSEQIFKGLGSGERTALMQCAAFDVLRRDVLVATLGKSVTDQTLDLIHMLALPTEDDDPQSQSLRLHGVILNFLNAKAKEHGLDLNAIRVAAALYLRRKGEWRKATIYALNAGDLALAASVTERGGGWRLIYRGEDGTQRQFHTLATLPRAAYQAYPKTALGLAIAAAKRGEIDHALDIAAHIGRMIGTLAPEMGAELRLVDALLCLYQDAAIQPDTEAQLENDILDTGTVDPVRLALTQNLLCFSNLQSQNYGAAIRYGRLSVATFHAAASDFGAAHLPLHIGQAEFFAGKIDNARATLERHLLHCETVLGNDADLTLMTRALHAEVDLEQGNIPADKEALNTDFAKLGSQDSWYDPLASLVMSSLRIARLVGGGQKLETILSRAEDVAFARNYDRLSRFIALQRIEVLLSEGQVSDAATLFALAQENHAAMQAAASYSPVNLRGLPLAALSARFDLATGAPSHANARLIELTDHKRNKANVPRFIRLALLRINALIAMGNKEEAAAYLDRLTLEFPVDRYPLGFVEADETVIQFVLDHAGRVEQGSLIARRLGHVVAQIARLAPPTSRPDHGPVLTTTEVEVVKRLEKGLSNKEIARDLGVSDNTVKFHLMNVYRKLDVRTRTAAAKRVRDSGILH